MKLNFMLIGTVLCAAGALHAQDNPVSGGTKTLYTMIKTNIVKAAQKMPEENYSYKPTPDVRSFGQVIGHIADAQYEFCAPVKGDKKSSDVEKTKTSKADLVAALQTAFTYCDGVYNAMTDKAAIEKIKFFGQDSTKIGILNFNVAHDNEHYGNIVTYMRLKGLVPPSSESSGSR
jgi:uncharacterized damage-inducible protein DinB